MRKVTSGARLPRGFTLTELIVASALALFLLSGLLVVLTSTLKANGRALKTARLHHALLGAAAVMRDELRRAGYWSRAEQTVLSGARNGFSGLHVVGGRCVLFSYDRDRDDPDGRPDETDQAGFRLRDGRLQTKTGDAGCGGSTCRQCDSGQWWSVTDPRSVTITGLSFIPEQTAVQNGQPGVRELAIVVTGQLRRHPRVTGRVETTVNIRNDETR